MHATKLANATKNANAVNTVVVAAKAFRGCGRLPSGFGDLSPERLRPMCRPFERPDLAEPSQMGSWDRYPLSHLHTIDGQSQQVGGTRRVGVVAAFRRS